MRKNLPTATCLTIVTAAFCGLVSWSCARNQPAEAPDPAGGTSRSTAALRQALISTLQQNAGRAYDLEALSNSWFTGSGQLRSRFSPDGALSLKVSDDHLEVSLEGIKRKGSSLLPAPPIQRTRAKGNRLSYQRAGETSLEEWYLNGPLGLEQGFELARRPSGNGELQVILNTTGSLSATIDRGTVIFRNAKGSAVLRYGDAFAHDADGRELPIEIALADTKLILKVNDQKARYPISIDPLFVELQKLAASDTAVGNSFGSAVAVSGNTAVIGAFNGTGLGAAYVFTRTGLTWTEQQKLTASDGMAGDFFGGSVAIDADTVVVGATGGASPGAAYVFTRTAGTWSEQQKLTASDSATGHSFGLSVGIDNDSVIVGDHARDAGLGAAYVFTRSGTTWTEEQRLTASDGATLDNFGFRVAISGDSALVGALGDESHTGAAYVYVRSGTTWSEQQKLTASDGAPNSQFGFSVALQGDTALVGAQGASPAGAAYVFTRSGTTWSEQQKLTSSDAATGDRFGYAVDLDGATIAVGAIGANSLTGAAYVFNFAGSTWTEQQKLTASDGAASDFFGWSVGLSGDNAVVGIRDSPTAAGAAYAFALLGSNGEACGQASDCATGNCVDGVCCDTACGGGVDDCQACNVAGSTGTCSLFAAGTECRASAGDCDVAEACDGLSGACPVDVVVSAGTECRAAVGGCDVAEACDGTSGICPADILVAAGTECRPSAGVCDVAETCNGFFGTCPADGFVGFGVECRPIAGGCDIAEACSGSAPTCPTDLFVTAGTQCRPAAGACDVAEACDGASAVCPVDAVIATGTECRAAVGPCDTPEACDGTNTACPADVLAPAGTECRAAVSNCDVAESCNGVDTTCPADDVVAAGTECRPSAGLCDVAESCDGQSNTCPTNEVAGAGTQCRGAANECDVAESCDGIVAACPTDTLATNGAICSGGTCNDGICIPMPDAGVPDIGTPDSGPSITTLSGGGIGCAVGRRGEGDVSLVLLLLASLLMRTRKSNGKGGCS